MHLYNGASFFVWLFAQKILFKTDILDYVRIRPVIKVISGKDTGKEGKVLQAFPKKGTVLVEGVNVNKKHQKPQGQTMQGGVIDKSMPINVSNVALVVKKKSGRVGYKFDKNGKKYRVLVQTGDEV